MATGTVGYTYVAEASRQQRQRRFNDAYEEISRLSETDVGSKDYYASLLEYLEAATGAAAGVIWSRTKQGQFHADHSRHFDRVDVSETHDHWLRQVFETGKPAAIPVPDSTANASNDATLSFLILAPILFEQRTMGAIEIWLDAPGTAETQAAFVQFLVGMAHYASIFSRNRKLRDFEHQQQLWARLEQFSRQIHASLDPRTVAFTIVNEGRALVAADRLSVARRLGGSSVIEAVSGVDVLDPRANQLKRLSRLCYRVQLWGEPLSYHGVPDESLPPDVLRALDDYLADSNAKQLMVLPLHEESRGQSAASFALVMECFEPVETPDPLRSQLEVLGQHAASALTNAARYRRLPLRWLSEPLARLREDLFGRTLNRLLFILLVLVSLATALVTVPYPLKIDVRGQLLPKERRWLYAPVEGHVVRIEPGVRPGSMVAENQALILMYDMQLELKQIQLMNDIALAQDEIASLTAQQTTARSDAERNAIIAEKKQKEYYRNRKAAELTALRNRTHADATRPGHFWLKSPLNGTVLSWDFRERLTNRAVKPSDPLLRIGDKDHGWEVELQVQHSQVGPVMEAFSAGGADLDVDLLLTSVPTRHFKGKLAPSQLARAAVADHESELPQNIVRAMIRIDGPDIADADRIPAELLLTGGEVHGKINCGDHRLGYSLFHGVWEFLHERVLY